MKDSASRRISSHVWVRLRSEAFSKRISAIPLACWHAQNTSWATAEQRWGPGLLTAKRSACSIKVTLVRASPSCAEFTYRDTSARSERAWDQLWFPTAVGTV